ncbi:MAG: polyphosphate polymerase domain-containing protein [Anaerolineae bacterium]|nr:polyphosphate polymerase domain-containing protein [Anaerolineae bacterium]
MPPQSETGFRYERKFLVDEPDVHRIVALLKRHPALFVSPYPPRYVNNVYLDTADLRNYFENVDGFGDRQKVRIRWYGDLLGAITRPILEFKIKRGLVGTKASYPLAPCVIARGFSRETLHALWRDSDLAHLVRVQLQDLQPVLVNRYYRRYFATRDGRYRVTLDTGMTYVKAGSLRSTFTHRQIDARHVVVELKYEPAHAAQAHRIVAAFPFTMTRNSKYVQGMERVYFT